MRRKYIISVYKGRAGWYWTLRSGNGKKIADGAEAYASKGTAVRAVKTLVAMLFSGQIEVSV